MEPLTKGLWPAPPHRSDTPIDVVIDEIYRIESHKDFDPDTFCFLQPRRQTMIKTQYYAHKMPPAPVFGTDRAKF